MPPKRKSTSVLTIANDSINIDINAKKQRTSIDDEKQTTTTEDTSKTSSDEDSNHTPPPPIVTEEPSVVDSIQEAPMVKIHEIVMQMKDCDKGEERSNKTTLQETNANEREEDDRSTLYSSDSRNAHNEKEESENQRDADDKSTKTVLSTTPVCEAFEPDMDALIRVWFADNSSQHAFSARHCKKCRHFHGPIVSLENTSSYREAMEEETMNCHICDNPCKPDQHNWVESPPDNVPVCSICFNSDGSDA